MEERLGRGGRDRLTPPPLRQISVTPRVLNDKARGTAERRGHSPSSHGSETITLRLPTPPAQGYAVTFAVDYPDRELNRLSTAFRIFTVIPIAIVLA